jgi:hypothetical protein
MQGLWAMVIETGFGQSSNVTCSSTGFRPHQLFGSTGAILPFGKRQAARDGDAVVAHSTDRTARSLGELPSPVRDRQARGTDGVPQGGPGFTGEDSPMAHLMLSVVGTFAEFYR